MIKMKDLPLYPLLERHFPPPPNSTHAHHGTTGSNSKWPLGSLFSHLISESSMDYFRWFVFVRLFLAIGEHWALIPSFSVDGKLHFRWRGSYYRRNIPSRKWLKLLRSLREDKLSGALWTTAVRNKESNTRQWCIRCLSSSTARLWKSRAASGKERKWISSLHVPISFPFFKIFFL